MVNVNGEYTAGPSRLSAPTGWGSGTGGIKNGPSRSCRAWLRTCPPSPSVNVIRSGERSITAPAPGLETTIRCDPIRTSALAGDARTSAAAPAARKALKIFPIVPPSLESPRGTDLAREGMKMKAGEKAAAEHGFRPIAELNEAREVWPRGRRLTALRDAAAEFKPRFKEQGTVTGVQTFPIASAPYPLKFAFGGAAAGGFPFINIYNRMLIVQYEDFDGELRTLVWEPTIPEGSEQAPFYAKLKQRYRMLPEQLMVSYDYGVEEAIAAAGLAPTDIDFASFDHLHVQDARRMLGTDEPRQRQQPAVREPVSRSRLHQPAGRGRHLPRSSPDAVGLVRARRHDRRPLERLIEIDGSVELGPGVAIIHTPGHTDGNQSLLLNTEHGTWISSENGVSSDSWQPELSKIPGIRKSAEHFGREVILNSNTLEDSLDQYDSMVLEKTLADPNHRDSRWLNVFPSSEMDDRKLNWPVRPTFTHGEIRSGRLVKPKPRVTA